MSIGDIIKVNIDGIPTLMEIKGFDNQHVVLVSTGNGQKCLIVERQKFEEDLTMRLSNATTRRNNKCV